MRSTPSLCVRARLRGEGWLDVAMHIEPGALASARAWRFRFTHAAHPAPTLRDPRGRRFGGGPIPRALRLRYRVQLPAGPPRPGSTFRRPGGFHLMGHSFLPRLEVDGSEPSLSVVLVMDVGGRPLWTAAGGERDLFEASSLRRLAEETYEIGYLSVRRRRVRGTELIVGTSGAAAAGALDRLAGMLERAMRFFVAELGPPPVESLLFVFHPTGDADFADRRGASVVWARPEGLPRELLYAKPSWARALVRLWTSPDLDAASLAQHPHDTWLDGLNEYLALRGVAEVALSPRETVPRLLYRTHERLLSAAALHDRPGPPGHEAGATTGKLISFCLDGDLSSAGSSLTSVLRGLLRRRDESLDTARLLQHVAAVHGPSASYLEALLLSRRPFLIDDCIERVGFELSKSVERLLDDDVVERSILNVDETDPVEATLAVRVTGAGPGSRFRAGDVLLSVAGYRVGQVRDVAYALRAHREGETFEVRLQRGGESKTLELTLPATDPELRQATTYVALRSGS